MHFSIELSLIIDEELRKKGIDRKIRSFDPGFCVFTYDELDKITSLELSRVSSLEGLELLPNLRKLIIKSPDFSNVSSDVDINDSNMNSIKDFSVISRLTKLEELQIINDINLSSLDITKLEELRNLTIVNNPNLKVIKGLEEKRNLQSVMLCGNALDFDFDIETYIKNTMGSRKNVLDVSLYISMVNKDINVANFLTMASIVGDTNIKFAERIGFLDFALLYPQNLQEMYYNFLRLFMKNSLYEKSDLDKIKYVYRYVKSRLSFDKEGLEEREKEYTNYMKEQKELPTFRKKKFASFHNSYVAYHFKKANCDGYVNLMRFMLSMLGVKSFNVHCHDKRSKFLASNHSILRVECDNKWYYCNPKYTPEDPKEIFMGSIEDLEKYYDFNIYESLISKGENYGDDSNALIGKKTL